MGGYKGIKADGGKVNQAKQLAAKIAKDIEACQKQTQQLAEYMKVVIGKDSSPIR